MELIGITLKNILYKVNMDLSQIFVEKKELNFYMFERIYG